MSSVNESTEQIARIIAETRAAATANETAVRDLARAVELQRAEVQALAARDVGSDSDRETRQRFAAVDGEQISGGLVRGGVVLVGGVSDRRGAVTGLLEGAPTSDYQRDLHQLVTARNVIRSAFGAHSTPKLDAQIGRHLAHGVKARIFTDSAGVGAEWIPDNVVPQIEETVRNSPSLAALFPSIPMSSNPQIIPYVGAGRPRPYKESIPTINDPAGTTLSDTVTGSNTISAVRMAAAVQLYRDASEDAVMDSMSVLMADISAGLLGGVVDCIVNGDSAATHQDAIASWNPRSFYATTGGAGTVVDHRRGWLGLRAEAYDNSATTNGNAVQTAAGIQALIGILDAACQAKVGGPARDIVLIVSPEVAVSKMLGFDEIETLDKVVNPTIAVGLGGFNSFPGGFLPGQIGTLYGCPVVLEPMLTADLASTGLYTGSGATSGVLAIDRSAYELRVRKAAMLETQQDIRNNTQTVVASWRGLFRKRGLSSTKTSAFSYNWL